METQVIDWGREALLTGLILAAPILLVGLVTGVITGVLQGITQVHDHALSFVPKILAMLVAVAVCLPWLVSRLADYWVTMYNGSTISGGF
ncbi:MAG: flagellar biosynthetic protein FliQ [Pirellulaceae bacterium]|nr:flagellar biosynthetic protein FliQ [Planctomycetales bacterium]